MNPNEYSPYHYNQQNTNQKQTASHKKYPSNKYYGFDDKQNDDVREKLFRKEKQPKDIFRNDRVKNFVKINYDYDDSVIEMTNKLTDNRKKTQNQSFQRLPRKSQKTNKSIKIQRAQSCTIQKIKPKKSMDSKQQHLNQQKQQELNMYKQLCITLRKQNEDLNTKVQKQLKRENKFCSEVQTLKEKIRKMYNHCIEKNKSSKNTDYFLKEIIKNNTKQQSCKKQANDKENFTLFINTKTNSKKKSKPKIDRNSNQQTIDSTTRTARRQFEASSIYLKNENCLNKKKTQKAKDFSIPMTQKNHSRPLNVSLKSGSRFPQYDMSEPSQVQYQTINNATNPLAYKEQTDQYKQFFNTFVKSLQIFQKDTTKQHKSKGKLLKDGGYYVQWAKHQWLEIVEYLIKKGYVAGGDSKKEKRVQSSTLSTVHLR